MKKWLLFLNLAFSMMGVGQIWMVQLSSYPLWEHVGPREFHDYHIAWWHSIWGPLFVPAGLAIICTILLFWHRPPTISRSLVWSAAGLLLATYLLTYIWWAPLMALIGATPNEFQNVFKWAPQLDMLALKNKTQGQLFDLLMITHWLRLVLLTAYGIVIFWMTFIASKLE